MTTRFLVRTSTAILFGLFASPGPAAAQPTAGAAPEEAAETPDESDSPKAAADEEAKPTSAAADKIRFAAIVQFATKGADKVDARKARTPLRFQDALYEGDRVRVERGAYAKLILKSGCIFVVYGDAQALAPNREKPWRVHAEGLRAICPETSRQTVSFRGSMIEVGGSEVLISGNRLLVLRGAPAAKGLQGAKPLSLFASVKGGWAAVTPAPGPAEAYQFHQSRPAPSESVALNKPEAPKAPKRPATTRLLFGPVLGNGSFMHDHKTYNDSSMQVEGGRIQAHFKSGDRSVIIAVTPQLSLDGREENEPCSGTSCPPAPGETIANMELSAIEGGVRFSHAGWWSPYVRGGLMYAQNRIMLRETNGNFYRHRVEHYGVTLAAGADAYWRPLSWFGLYANGEIFAARAIFTGADRDESACATCGFVPPPPAADPANPYSFAGLNFGFGFFGQW